MIRIKSIVFSIICVFVLGLSSKAQDNYKAKSGDGELDTHLNKINVDAHADLSLFKKKLSVDFNIAEGKLNDLMVSYGMQPADLYMVLEVSKLGKKTVDNVADCYKVNKDKGWGVIAKQMGIKPGSKEFHELKNSAKKNKHGDNNDQGEDHDEDGDNGKGKGNKNGGSKHGNGNGHGNGHGKGKGK